MAHVDKVHDDEAADIPQAELAGDFFRRLDVGLENHLVHILGATVAAGVHVHGNECFGLINDDVAAAFQPHLARECLVDLLLDIDALKDGLVGSGKVVDAALGTARDLPCDLANEFGGFRVIAEHLIHFLSEEIAAVRSIRFRLLENADGAGLFARR